MEDPIPRPLIPPIANRIKITENFTLREFESPDTGQVIIHPFLVELLQKLRRVVDKKVKITSGYRTKLHNAHVGGVPRSRHMYGDAVDIAIEGETVEDVAQLCRRVGFPLAIPYPEDGHVHVSLGE